MVFQFPSYYCFSQQGESGAGLKSLQQAFDLDPACVSCLVNSAAIFNSLGETMEAKKHYNLALHIKPHDPNVLNNYSVFLEQQGSYNRLYLIP